MDKVIKGLKQKFLMPTVNKYYDDKAPAVTMQEIQAMYEHAKGIAALIEVEEYCDELSDEIKDEIKDELMGAQNYYRQYMETKDHDFLQMMLDETTHARKFILEYSSRNLEAKERAWVQTMLEWHDDLVRKYEELTQK